MNHSRSVKHIRGYALRAVLSTAILVSPVIAFLIVIAIEVLIDLSMAAGASAVSAVVIASIGLVLSRKFLPSAFRVLGSKNGSIAHV
jgi:nitrate reductase gamma subunit